MAPSNPSTTPERRERKFEKVRESIRTDIKNGRYKAGQRLPSQTDLADDLSVNHLTIRRALQDLVREGLIVRRRGSGTYVADREKPPVMPGRNLRLGVVWRNFVLPTTLLEGIEAGITRGVLGEWGLTSAVPTFPVVSQTENTRAVWMSSDQSVRVEAIGESHAGFEMRPDLDSILSGGFDGILTTSIIENEWLARLIEHGVPVVIADYQNERFDSLADQVYFDPMSAYRAAVFHFVAQGLRRIHFVGCNLHVPAPGPEMGREEWIAYNLTRNRADPDSYLRMNAYRQALHEQGLATHDEWIHFARPDQNHSEALGEQLLNLPEGERPEAVVCHGSQQAEFLINCFERHGAVLRGVGASEGAERKALPVRADLGELGSVAASLLISRLQQPNRPHIRVGVPMHFRSDHTGNEAQG